MTQTFDFNSDDYLIPNSNAIPGEKYKIEEGKGVKISGFADADKVSFDADYELMLSGKRQKTSTYKLAKLRCIGYFWITIIIFVILAIVWIVVNR